MVHHGMAEYSCVVISDPANTGLISIRTKRMQIRVWITDVEMGIEITYTNGRTFSYGGFEPGRPTSVSDMKDEQMLVTLVCSLALQLEESSELVDQIRKDMQDGFQTIIRPREA